MKSDNSSLSSSVPPLKRQNNELYNSKPEISASLSSSVSEVIDYTDFSDRIINSFATDHRIQTIMKSLINKQVKEITADVETLCYLQVPYGK